MPRCAALLALLAGRATAVDDTSALVQAQVRPRNVDVDGIIGGTASIMGGQLGSVYSAAAGRFSQHVSSALAELSHRLGPAAGVEGPGGFVAERTLQTTPGNTAVFNISKGCTVEDEYGQNNCTIHWGDEVTFFHSIHLAEGIMPGDSIEFGLNITLEAENKSEDISKIFSGTPMGLNLSCEICTGSCTSALTLGATFFETVRPTLFSGDAFCETDEDSLSAVTDFVVRNVTAPVPAGPPESWGLTGHLWVFANIIQNGTTTLSSAITQTIVPGGSESAMRAYVRASPAQPSSFLEAMDHVYRRIVPARLKEARESEAAAKYRERKAPVEEARDSKDVAKHKERKARRKEARDSEAVEKYRERKAVAPAPLKKARDSKAVAKWKARQARLKEARDAKAATKNNESKAEWNPQKLGALVVGTTLSDVGSGSHAEFALSADHGCTHASASNVQCHFPFNSSNELTLGLHSSYTAEEGAIAKVKITVKMGGLMGLLTESLMKPIDIELPLCGSGTATFAGQSSVVDFGSCGYFSSRLIAPPFQVFVPDLAELPIVSDNPVLPAKLGDLPPTGLEIATTVQRKDGQVMWKSTMVVALDYA